MKYSVLTAPLYTIDIATTSLLKPVVTEVRYAEEATILDFDTEEEAIEHVQQFLPFDKVLALPGQREGLEFYASVWMGKDETCLQDLLTLSQKLTDKDNFHWDYGQKDAEQLKASMDEYDDCHEEKEFEEQGNHKYVVGSLLMGDSQLLGGRSSFMLMLNCDLEFEDLTEEEQISVIDPATINRKKVTIDEGLMLDLWAIKKCNGNKRKAQVMLWGMYINDVIRSKKYALKSWFLNKYHRTATRINEFRKDRGWY